MLQAQQLPRVFLFKDKNEDIELSDPNPSWTADAVMNFYASTYPSLTTAQVSGPEINNDRVEFKFSSVIGTKG